MSDFYRYFRIVIPGRSAMTYQFFLLCATRSATKEILS